MMNMYSSKEYEISEACDRLSSGKNISAEFIQNKGDYPVFGGNGVRGYTSSSNFHGDCVIIGRQGAQCGNVRYFSGDAYMTEHAIVAIANKSHNTRYLSYVLSMMNLGHLSGQSAQPGLSVKVIGKQKIYLPTKEQQDKVVSILAPIDDKIEINNKINDNLEKQAQLIIRQYSDGIISKVYLHEIMDFDNGFPFQSKTYLDSGKYKIITIKNVTDGRIDTTGTAFIDIIPQKMKSCCKLEVGDVLVSLTGNVGRVGIVCESNLLLNQRVAKVKPKDANILPFLYFVFRQPAIKEQMIQLARGTAQANLSPVETLKISIPFEKETAISLSSMLSPLFNQIIQNNREVKLLVELRDYLLPRLLNGQISVGG